MRRSGHVHSGTCFPRRTKFCSVPTNCRPGARNAHFIHRYMYAIAAIKTRMTGTIIAIICEQAALVSPSRVRVAGGRRLRTPPVPTFCAFPPRWKMARDGFPAAGETTTDRRVRPCLALSAHHTSNVMRHAPTARARLHEVARRRFAHQILRRPVTGARRRGDAHASRAGQGLARGFNPLGRMRPLGGTMMRGSGRQRGRRPGFCNTREGGREGGREGEGGAPRPRPSGRSSCPPAAPRPGRRGA